MMVSMLNRVGESGGGDSKTRGQAKLTSGGGEGLLSVSSYVPSDEILCRRPLSRSVEAMVEARGGPCVS